MSQYQNLLFFESMQKRYCKKKITTQFFHKDISNAVPDVHFNIIFDHLIRKVIIYWYVP